MEQFKTISFIFSEKVRIDISFVVKTTNFEVVADYHTVARSAHSRLHRASRKINIYIYIYRGYTFLSNKSNFYG